MATQANITLTALAQQDELVPDIPVRKITLNHQDPEVILGRASIKEPKARNDGRVDKKTVSRIASVNNGYISRNETIASEHAALFLRRDGEVCLEHRAGRFPPTFLNGNQVIDCVPVENNDIINLGPLKPYTSKHKNRTYHPFALKLNLALAYKVLTGDDNSSSSSSSEDEDEDEDEDRMILNMASSSQEQKSTLSDTIPEHEVIDVLSSDEDASSSTHEDDRYDVPLTSHPSNPSKKPETVIIDLTENEVENDAQTMSRQSESTHITYAEYESSSESDDADDDMDKENTANLDDDMDVEGIEDGSIFGDDTSNAPSEEPIERSPVSGPFARGFRLDYSPDPELFDDIDLDSDMEFEEEEEEVYYEDPSSPVMPEHQIKCPHPYVSEELSKFQEEERQRLKKKETEDTEERRQEQQSVYDRREEMERGEGSLAKMEKQYEENRRELQQRMEQHAAAIIMASQRETSTQLVNREYDSEAPAMLAHSAQFRSSPPIPVSNSQADTQSSVFDMAQRRPDTPPNQHPPQQHTEFINNTLDSPTFDFRDMFGADNFCYVPATAAPTTEYNRPNLTYASRIKSAELPEHSSIEYSSARAENRAKVLNDMSQTQQETPPSLLMSGSLFGQPMGEGVTLPALPPHKLRDQFGNLKVETELRGRKLWYDEQTKTWMGRHRGKVSISDLVEQEDEDDYNGEAPEEAGQSKCLEGVQAVPMAMRPPETEKELELPKSKTELRKMNRVLLDKEMVEPLTCATADPVGANASDVQAVLTNKATAKSETEKSKLDTQSKKRKHVEFEEFETVIAPRLDSDPVPLDSVAILSVRDDGTIDTSVSLTSPDSSDFEMSAEARAGHQRETERHTKRLNGSCLSTEERQRLIAMNSEQRKTSARPTKRLKTARRVAEAVGLAALGGVAAAAGLFVALVASAPEEF